MPFGAYGRVDGSSISLQRWNSARGRESVNLAKKQITTLFS
jgi:hypothetical protein